VDNTVQVTVARVPRPNVAQSFEVQEGASVADVVRKVGAHPDQVIVIRGEQPMPLDALVREGDVLRVVNVFSGG
jgi:sulfur carrier protein ThiS